MEIVGDTLLVEPGAGLLHRVAVLDAVDRGLAHGSRFSAHPLGLVSRCIKKIRLNTRPLKMLWFAAARLIRAAVFIPPRYARQADNDDSGRYHPFKAHNG